MLMPARGEGPRRGGLYSVDGLLSAGWSGGARGREDQLRGGSKGREGGPERTLRKARMPGMPLPARVGT